MKRFAKFCTAVLALAVAGTACAAKPEVFVLGTLYKRHETVASYDLAALSRVIEAIAPDVIVVDATPTELAERKVFPGKVEYTQVIFPYLDAKKIKAYAGEPSEPMFSEIVGRGTKVREDLKANNPAGAAAMETYRKATYAALAVLWKDAADPNGEASQTVIEGLKGYEAAMLGLTEADGSHRWDLHAAQMTLTAIKENPGKRVLQIAGVENLPVIRATLRAQGVELVDMESWIRANASAPRKDAK